jgi:hypothetical protein
MVPVDDSTCACPCALRQYFIHFKLAPSINKHAPYLKLISATLTGNRRRQNTNKTPEMLILYIYIFVMFYFKGIQAVRIAFFFISSICAMCTFSSSTSNFTHAQTLSRMSSLSGRMNIARESYFDSKISS